jgi:hypothetical protein
MKNGLKGIDLDKLPKNDEELAKHLENEHGIIVKRNGETNEQAKERCKKKGIVEDRTKCKCNDCRRLRKEIK